MVKRVSDNILHEQTLSAVNNTRRRQMENQEKTITGKRINAPSDDPIGTSQVLKVKNEERNIEQFKTNAALVENIMNTGDKALETASEILMRAQELAISQSSSGSATPNSRKSVAHEVAELTRQMVAVGNTRFGERYIFGGYEVTDNPFAGVGMYKGDSGVIPIEVRQNYYLPLNIPGSIPFLGEGRKDGVNVFAALERLKTGLETNNKEMIQSTLNDFESGLSQVTSVRATIGARVKAIELCLNTSETDTVEKARLRSELEDADMVSAFSELNKDENVLKRTLQTSEKLIQSNLFDYIR